jgi:hypothetical protein
MPGGRAEAITMECCSHKAEPSCDGYCTALTCWCWPHGGYEPRDASEIALNAALQERVRLAHLGTSTTPADPFTWNIPLPSYLSRYPAQWRERGYVVRYRSASIPHSYWTVCTDPCTLEEARAIAEEQFAQMCGRIVYAVFVAGWTDEEIDHLTGQPRRTSPFRVEQVQAGEKGPERYREDPRMKRYLLAKRPDDPQRMYDYRTAACVAYNDAVEANEPRDILDFLRAEHDWAFSQLPAESQAQLLAMADDVDEPASPSQKLGQLALF